MNQKVMVTSRMAAGETVVLKQHGVEEKNLDVVWLMLVAEMVLAGGDLQHHLNVLPLIIYIALIY